MSITTIMHLFVLISHARMALLVCPKFLTEMVLLVCPNRNGPTSCYDLHGPTTVYLELYLFWLPHTK